MLLTRGARRAAITTSLMLSLVSCSDTLASRFGTPAGIKPLTRIPEYRLGANWRKHDLRVITLHKCEQPPAEKEMASGLSRHDIEYDARHARLTDREGVEAYELERSATVIGNREIRKAVAERIEVGTVVARELEHPSGVTMEVGGPGPTGALEMINAIPMRREPVTIRCQHIMPIVKCDRRVLEQPPIKSFPLAWVVEKSGHSPMVVAS
jgi:hypothetical protein